MTEGSASFNPPRGMRDFYPEDMASRNAIFGAWAEASLAFGFSNYDSCVVESLEVLKRKAGEEIVDQIYCFTDKSGRELALRAEMTPTLARMIAARQGSLSLPLKWFTVAQCFRYERMTRGRKREHYQWNLDIIGEPSPSAEAEVISCALNAMRLLGLGKEQVRVRFNSRALLGDLLGATGLRPDLHQAVFLPLDKRGKVSDEEIASMLQKAGLDEKSIRCAFDLLAVTSLDEVVSRVGEDKPSVAHVRRFLHIIAAYGFADMVEFNISVIRGLSYYTGIVFEAFDLLGNFRAIFGGGRYDNLLGEIGGSSITGVGLGFGDVVIAEILADLGKLPANKTAPDIAIGFMQPEQQDVAIRMACRLRVEGKRVDLALRPEKAKHFFSRAGSQAFHEAAYIGPDDAARGTVRVKDLATRTERELPL
jgi:histidyl-tRNA synthetase